MFSSFEKCQLTRQWNLLVVKDGAKTVNSGAAVDVFSSLEDSVNAWVSRLKSWCLREGKQWEIGKSRWIISFEWIIIYCGAHFTAPPSSPLRPHPPPHFINPGNLAPPKTYWNPYSYFDHLQWPWEKMTQDNWYDSRLPLTADPAMTMEWTRNYVILMLCLYSLQKVFYLCVVIRSHIFSSAGHGEQRQRAIGTYTQASWCVFL